MSVREYDNRFSLVELLVVLTVIMILSALLLPSLRNARAKAQEVACSNNMKQFGLALALYTQDFDDYLPGQANTVGLLHYRYSHFWRHFYVPYYMGATEVGKLPPSDLSSNWPTDLWSVSACQRFNRQGILSCPTAISVFGEGYPDSNTLTWTGTGTFTLNQSVINMNYSLSYGYDDTVYRLNQLVQPSAFGLGFDGTTWGAYDKGDFTASGEGGPGVPVNYWLPSTVGDNNYGQPVCVHGGTSWRFSRSDMRRNFGYFLNGRSNVLHGDFHVEAMRASDFAFGYDGTPHHDWPSGASCTRVHERGFGLGDRNDRTMESVRFWYGKSAGGRA
ncbi:MAG: DUF1559 domain-containing protein, partial [Lentisphaerae bacterium]